uniref:Disease resistance R13L4/SHOC-2-like LRR domain-containing protein n=1 Tax=Fagus sylvatica TaxID=28930 RepID=A0A2N9IAT2_FAGSY
MSSSNPSQSQHESPTNNFTVPLIHEAIIPKLLDRLSRAKGSLNEDNIEDYGKMDTQLEKLRKDLSYIKLSFSKLNKFEDKAKDLFNLLNQHTAEDSLANLIVNVRNPTLRAKQLRSKLSVISDIVLKLKLQIPSPHKVSITDSEDHRYKQVGISYGFDELPDLHDYYTLFDPSDAFLDFKVIYNSLDLRTKLCLLCFSLILENEVVKKRLFVYWWVGEGFINPNPQFNGGKTYEKMGDEIFETLVKTGCIEPVNKKRRLVVDCYKMNPFIRSAVIELAKEAQFFDFDEKGNLSADFSKSYRACLVLNGSAQKVLRTIPPTGSQSDKQKSQTISNDNEPSQSDQSNNKASQLDQSNNKASQSDQSNNETSQSDQSNNKPAQLDQEKLQTIFNVSEPYPDFFELEWFSKLKNVKVLYLGRWQNSAKHHIEVENSEFLKGLRNMKFLRFFSLQGISIITKLPDSLCKLSSLRILDLRACHNLEALPDGIGSLKKLTHLDISECYLLDYIPKGIALLAELQVLKGFVVGDRISTDSCTLQELSGLPKSPKFPGLRKLRKLSIYTNRKDFPSDVEESALQHFEKLQKLTIAWGGGVEQDKGAKQPTESSKKSGDNKEQDKGAKQPMAAISASPKSSGDNKKPDKGVAQPSAATIMSPKKSGDNKEQDKGVAQRIAATSMSPNRSGDSKRQDNCVAEPMSACTTSPNHSGNNKNPDKGAAQQMAANTVNPENSGDKKNQDKGIAGLANKLLKAPTFNFRQGTKPVYLEEFKELEKLDLQCYPQMTAPSWLTPGKLDKLKKLYIRGGELQKLGQENDEWKVEILRVKFLSNLKMDWRELRASFPDLIYLEKVNCPKLTLFPCDENGLWLKP